MTIVWWLLGYWVVGVGTLCVLKAREPLPFGDPEDGINPLFEAVVLIWFWPLALGALAWAAWADRKRRRD